MPVLKGNNNFYDYSVSDVLGENLKQFYIYGLLEKGAYTAAIFSDTETSGQTTLQRSYDPRYGNRVYEGMGPSWVWQDAASVPSGYASVFQVSGIYVDKTFYPTDTAGIYAHSVDYNNGRIIFDNGISDSVTVECEYVYNDVDILLSDESKWKKIVYDYTSQFNEIGSVQPSGLSSLIKENRGWLPTFVIEIDEIPNINGLQLGGGEKQEFVVRYHVFASNPFVRNRLIDIVHGQFQKVLDLYNINDAPYHFNFDGTLASGALEYSILANRSGSYFYTYAYIQDSNGGKVNSSENLYRAEMKHIVNVDRYLSTY